MSKQSRLRKKLSSADERDASEMRACFALQEEWQRQLKSIRDADSRRMLELAIERMQHRIEGCRLRMWKRKCERERAKEPTLFDAAAVGQAVKKSGGKKGQAKGGEA